MNRLSRRTWVFTRHLRHFRIKLVSSPTGMSKVKFYGLYTRVGEGVLVYKLI
jgi:hypothetical protein